MIIKWNCIFPFLMKNIKTIFWDKCYVSLSYTNTNLMQLLHKPPPAWNLTWAIWWLKCQKKWNCFGKVAIKAMSWKFILIFVLNSLMLLPSTFLLQQCQVKRYKFSNCKFVWQTENLFFVFLCDYVCVPISLNKLSLVQFEWKSWTFICVHLIVW